MIEEPCAPESVYNAIFAVAGILVPNFTMIIIAYLGLRSSRNNGRLLRNGNAHKQSADYETWLDQLEKARQKKGRSE